MALFPGIKSFLVEKFWLPLTDESVYYNPFNTVVYAIGFAAAAVYIGRPMLERFDIEVDRGFALGLAPFIFLGGAVRVLEDKALVNTMLLKTPFIYALMFGLVAAILAASKLMESRFEVPYYRTLSVSGLFILSPLLVFYMTRLNPLATEAFLMAGAIEGALVLVIHFGLKQFRPELATPAFEIPVMAHYWDAATSFTALTLSSAAAEEHVLAGFFIDQIGPSGIFLAKTMVIVPAVYLVYDGFDGEERNYYLLLVGLLGLALGTRNILSLTVA